MFIDVMRYFLLVVCFTTQSFFSVQSQDLQVTTLATIPGKQADLVAFENGAVFFLKNLRFTDALIAGDNVHFVVKKILVSPDGKIAVLHGDDKKACPEIWNLETKKLIGNLPERVSAGACVITNDSKHLIVGDDSGFVRWYRLIDGDLSFSFYIGDSNIKELYFKFPIPCLSVVTSRNVRDINLSSLRDFFDSSSTDDLT